MPNVQNFDVTAGEDRTLSMTARAASGAIQSLTGATIECRISLNLGDTALLSKTGTIVSAAAGTYTVPLTASDTTDLYGDYQFQSRITISSAVTIGTKGVIRIEAANQ